MARGRDWGGGARYGHCVTGLNRRNLRDDTHGSDRGREECVLMAGHGLPSTHVSVGFAATDARVCACVYCCCYIKKSLMNLSSQLKPNVKK